MNNREKLVDSLKKFFAITLAAFDFFERILSLTGGAPNEKLSELRSLHEAAFNALNEERPSLEKVYALLIQMELVANTPFLPDHIRKHGFPYSDKENIPNYIKGGIVPGGTEITGDEINNFT